MDNTPATVPDDPEKAKHIRKPAQHVLDLLEGHATWSNQSDTSKIAPGIQLLAEEEADNEESEDWTTSTSGYIEEYVFAAEVAGSEALEPQSLKEAKARPDWPLWEKAIEEELEVLRAAGTWELVNAPEGANIVGLKWVFRAKKDAAGNIVRYKAQLVAQGFSQVPGIDYFNMFAPVAWLASIRTVLAFAAANNLETGQIDIKGAYLNGELTEKEMIFMKQAPGYAIPNPDGAVLVCKLRKTLYGLKQSGRRWYQKLVGIMEKLGFVRSEVDQGVFYRRDEGQKILIIVLVHVDCLIVVSSQPLISRFKIEIKKHVH